LPADRTASQFRDLRTKRVVVVSKRTMSAELVFSVALLTAFLWAMRFLLPRAIKERDPLAIVCAVLFTLLAFAAWLFFGVGI
jgi:hypothetical protein